MVIRDRLKELQKLGGISTEADEQEEFVVTIQNSNRNMELLQKNVDNINQNIDKMEELVKEMKNAHAAKLSATGFDQKTQRALDDININFKLLSKQTREGLRAIQVDLLDLEKKNETNCAAYRIRKTQFTTLQNRAMDVVNLYNAAQDDYSNKCKDLIKRQLEITGQTGDDVDKLLDNPNPEIFIQGILTDTKIAKQQLEEIKSRHEDIIKIEKSIRELHEMFVDMAELVHQQGEVIDRIETHVQQTHDYVEKGKEQTKQAVEYQTKARKLKIIIIIIVIVILILIFVSIFGV